MNLQPENTRRLDWTAWVAWGVGAASLLALVAYQYRLLNFMQYGDESETIVAAKMMVAGSSLYRDFFNHHGPLTFLPGMIVELLGGHTVAAHRVFIDLLQLAALASLFFSPLIKGKHVVVRVTYVLVVATIYVAVLPAGFGHTYIYQVMCGLMLTIALSGWLLPLLGNDGAQGGTRTITGSALIACLPFLAITYLPASAALLIASLHRDNWRKVVLGTSAAVVLNLIFLATTGSLRGYLAFHIYLNATILPLFNEGQAAPLIQNAFFAATSDLGSLLQLALVVGSLAFAAGLKKGFPWRHVLVGLAIGSLLLRGLAFHGLSYQYAALALPLLLVARLDDRSVAMRGMLLILGTVLLARLVTGGQDERAHIAKYRIPETTEFSRLAKALTRPGDRILAYSFQNYEYIASDRLPASGYYFYFPWQQKYLEHPVLGIRIDPCEDINTVKPKIVMLHEWKVWDRVEWSSYGACISSALARDYVRLPHTIYYVRNDIAAAEGLVGGPADTFGASAQVAKGDQIEVRNEIAANDRTVRSVGALMGTYGRRNEGTAALIATLPDGSTKVLSKMPLADMQDNAYAYFGVPAGTHGKLSIQIMEGGGVSFWEAGETGDAKRACVVVEYSTGPGYRVPGCPVDFSRVGAATPSPQ
ncbi:hypothetical protein [Stenotrophomonas maltophilia]|uniref:hypothetical protein n=1 Tax=Stenotrophomonas maltophilia TaxID=40324 RepID=UPI0013FDE6A6|nr:hypothetical protein [Stenotrophomonas maltophilia]